MYGAGSATPFHGSSPTLTICQSVFGGSGLPLGSAGLAPIPITPGSWGAWVTGVAAVLLVEEFRDFVDEDGRGLCPGVVAGDGH